VVESDHAALGHDGQGVTAVCLAPLHEAQAPLEVACHPDDGPRAVARSRQRPAGAQPNRDLTSHWRLRTLHRKTPASLDRLWGIFGLAFYSNTSDIF